ncbi:hypothetical protein AB0A05_37615 [Streptomyces sp. NPDC046374]|uniref:hypothetical protein n=1 Tax=Streptomyces sp. NPDC046374 TaxID=3154917 RepID=UPI00340276E6
MAAVAALALIPVLGGASLATAGGTGVQALTCPGSGDVTPGDKCTTLSNGVLMINETSTGSSVGLQYYKSGGAAVSARLGYLRQGVNHWGGWQSMTAVNTYYAQWSGLSGGCYPTNGLLNTTGGATYQTPAADPC